jgi:hypothetical protein
MASSKSPYVLQAIGEAAAAAMPGARADKKERKAAQDRAVEGLMELGARNRKEAMEGLRIAVPIWQAGMSAEEAERSLQFREKELQSRETQAELDRQVTIAAALARQNNPSTFETQLAAYRKAYPNFSDVALFKEMRKDGLLGGGQGGMALLGAEETGGAGGDTSGMSIVGSRPVQ